MLSEFEHSVFRLPETNMHINWCLRGEADRQIVRGMAVKRALKITDGF